MLIYGLIACITSESKYNVEIVGVYNVEIVIVPNVVKMNILIRF